MPQFKALSNLRGGLVFPMVEDKGLTMEEIIQNAVLFSLDSLEKELIITESKVILAIVSNLLKPAIDKANKSIKEKRGPADSQIEKLAAMLPKNPLASNFQSSMRKITSIRMQGEKDITQEELRLSSYNHDTILKSIEKEIKDKSSNFLESIRGFRDNFLENVVQPLYEKLQQSGGAVYDVSLVNKQLVEQYKSSLRSQDFNTPLAQRLAVNNDITALASGGLALDIKKDTITNLSKALNSEDWETCTIEHSVNSIQDKIINLDIDFLKELKEAMEGNKSLLQKFCDTKSRPFKLLVAAEKDLIPEKWEYTMINLLQKIPEHIQFIVTVHRELCLAMSKAFIQMKYVVNENVIKNAIFTYNNLNTLGIHILGFPGEIQKNMLRLENAIKTKKESREVEQSQSSHYIKGVIGSLFSATANGTTLGLNTTAYKSSNDDPENNDDPLLFGGLNYEDHSTTVLFRIEKASDSFGNLITSILDGLEVIANTPSMSQVFYKISAYYQPLTKVYTKMSREIIIGHQLIYETAYKELESFFNQTGGVDIGAIGISKKDLENRKRENKARYVPEIYDALRKKCWVSLEKRIEKFLSENKKKEKDYNITGINSEFDTFMIDIYTSYDKSIMRRLNLSFDKEKDLSSYDDYLDILTYAQTSMQKEISKKKLESFLIKKSKIKAIPSKHAAAFEFAISSIGKYCKYTTNQFSDITDEIQYILKNELDSPKEKANKLIFLENTSLNIFEKNSRFLNELINFADSFILDFYERNLELERSLKAYKRTEATWNIINGLGHGAIGVFFIIHPVNMGVILLIGGGMSGIKAFMQWITYNKSSLGNKQDVETTFKKIESMFNGIPDALRIALNDALKQREWVNKNIAEAYKLIGKSISSGNSPDKPKGQPKELLDPFSIEAFYGMFDSNGEIGISLSALNNLPEKLDTNKDRKKSTPVDLGTLDKDVQLIFAELGVNGLVDVVGDGNCLYRAFAYSMFNDEKQANAVGKSLISFLDMMLLAMKDAEQLGQFISLSQFEGLGNQELKAVAQYFQLSKSRGNAFPVDPAKKSILSAYQQIVSKGAYFNGGGDLMPLLLSFITDTRVDIVNHAGNIESFGEGGSAVAIIYRQPNHFQAAKGKGQPSILTYPTKLVPPKANDEELGKVVIDSYSKLRTLLDKKDFIKNLPKYVGTFYSLKAQIEFVLSYYGTIVIEQEGDVYTCIDMTKQLIGGIYIDELAKAIETGAPLTWWVNETKNSLGSTYLNYFNLNGQVEDFQFIASVRKEEIKKVDAGLLGKLQETIEKELGELTKKPLGQVDLRSLLINMKVWTVSINDRNYQKHLENLTDFIEMLLVFYSSENFEDKTFTYNMASRININTKKTQELFSSKNQSLAGIFSTWKTQFKKDYSLFSVLEAQK